jgi:hypothetical protein
MHDGTHEWSHINVEVAGVGLEHGHDAFLDCV